jgi:hypothetical protein
MLAQYNTSTAKLVEAVDENIVWSTSRHEGALVHAITIIISPNYSAKANLVIRAFDGYCLESI